MAAMLWGALAGAGLGLLRARNAQKRTEEYNKAQGEIQKYSPWTGLHGQVQQAPDGLGTIAQGALTGAMVGQGLGGGGEAAAAETASASATPSLGVDYSANALGANPEILQGAAGMGASPYAGMGMANKSMLGMDYSNLGAVPSFYTNNPYSNLRR